MGDDFFFDILDHLWYTVEYVDLSHKGRLGECIPSKKLINLHHGLSTRQHGYVLGHETAHAINGDVPSVFGFFNERMERKADEWSARMCIDIYEFRDLEMQYSGHAATIAFHLNVPTEAVEVFRASLHRIKDDVYVNARMGAGQWAKKVSA